MTTPSRPSHLACVDAPRARFEAPRLRKLALLLLLFVAAPGLLPAQPASLQVRQLSPEGNANSDVLADREHRRVSPDGKWILFFTDADTNDVEDLYSVSRFGGEPVRLSALRPAGSDPISSTSFLITPDSRRVIFRLDQETLGRSELWSVPIQGPASAAVKLSPNLPLAAEVSGTAILSADGQYVGFRFQEPFAMYEGWSAPVDGTAPAFPLQPAYPPGASGVGHWSVQGSRAFFVGDFATAEKDELWSAPLDGSTGAVRLNGSLIADGDVENFMLSEDGERVLYFADQRFDGRVELYSVPIAGPFSAATRISPDFPASADVTDAMTSDDSSRALFLADSSVDEQFELWSVPIDGPATDAVKLNGSLVAGGDVDFSVSEHDGVLTYLADAVVDERFELFRVPTAGPSSAGGPVSGTIVSGGDVAYGGVADLEEGPMLFMVGDLRVNDKYEAYTAEADGSTTARPFFTELPDGQGFVSECGGGLAHPPSAFLFCAEAVNAGRVRLYRAPFDLLSEPQHLSTGALAVSDVTWSEVDPTGKWVAYRYDRDVDEQFNLYRIRADGTGNPHRVHAVPIPAGADIAETDGFDFTPDGAGIVYLADHDVDEKWELWISDGMIFRADFEWGGLEEWAATAP